MPPSPPLGLTGWQWIAFFAITSGVAALQSYLLHKKIDAASAAPAPPAEEKNP